MTQTSSKKEQLNGKNGKSPQTETSKKSVPAIPLQEESTQDPSQGNRSWWQKLGQRWNNISFRNKLTLLVVGSVAVPVVAITQAAIYLEERQLLIDLNRILNLQLNSLEGAIDDNLEELEEEAGITVTFAKVTEADLNDPNAAAQVLQNTTEEDSDESFYIITNRQGETVAQRIQQLDQDFSSYPLLPSDLEEEAEEGEEEEEEAVKSVSKPLGIPLSDVPAVQKVLQTGEGVTSVELLKSDVLQQLGLAEQAAIGLREQEIESLPEPKQPYPEGTYDIEQGKSGMVLMSVQPVIRNNQLVGTVIYGTLINRNYEIVDDIQRATGTSTATIFAQDWRVSTNVPYTDETTRAIGTRVSRVVADTVLNRGETFLGEANIIGIEYLTAYSPLYNHEGETVGIAYIGDPKTQINAVLRQAALIQYGIGASILLVGAGIALLISRNLSTPILRLSNFAQKVGSGNYGLRMEGTENREDEIGQLSQDLNRMVSNLEVTQAELRRDSAETGFLARVASTPVTSEEAFKELADQSLAEARGLMQVDRLVIYRFQEDGSGYIANESVIEGLKPAKEREIKDPCIPEEIRQAYLEGRVVPTRDVFNAGFHPDHLQLMKDLQIRANLVVPIIVRESLYGLLIAHNCHTPYEWQEREIKFMQRLALEIGSSQARLSFLEDLQKAEEEQRQEKEKLQRRALELLMQVDPISKGDLTINASVTDDEIGTVADSYNSTVENLRKIVGQVKEAAQAVGDTTTKNETEVQALSQGALEQSREIEAALDRIEAMTRSINAVSESAAEAEGAIQKSAQTVKAGDEAMNRTVDGIMSIRETVAETAKKVKRLGESSQKISQVVNLISNFADQTNLLALNASIEAARAGEQGRGFAVVADEVRALAQQSADATAEISNLVDQIQTETNEVVTAMEQGTEQVVSGTQLVEEARANLNQITGVSNQINELVAKIAEAAKTQSVDSEQVNQTIKDVAAIAQRTSESATQVSDSFKELLQTAQNLEQNVGQFKVE
ncbi:MAG: GAF domain-containing protein [Cyanobacteria bacterium]|jgi:methyl-accepting chemotaxis protein PixJ|nr:GAF domain-containing protein [Cyanobacteria bacterium GSL.Bin1]